MKQLTPFITERDGIPVTTSRAVAEQFGKNHKEVLRAIDNLLTDLNAQDDTNIKEFTERNFALSDYRDSTGRELPEYLLTRDGFTLLAMGFTGAKALTFKVAYINAFNHMEQLLRGGITSSALKNIEERLQALEKTAGEGRSDAVDKVAQTYLDALKEAIKSGKYTIEKRFARHDNPKKLLGLEDYDYVAVKTVLSYRIYSAYAKKPLARLALWGVLEGAGAILPKDKRPTRVNISGTKYTVIYIPTSKLFDRAEEAENRTE